MTSSPSYSRKYPPVPLGLLAFAFATVAAFAVTIHGDFAEVPHLWTPCSPHIPTPVCFAVQFFQEAHGTPRGRLEQAVIVSFLAALSSITAIERTRARRRAAIYNTTTTKDITPGSSQHQREGQGLSDKIVNNLTIAWLLYGLVMGALAWQLIIVPAFLHQHHRYEQQRQHQQQPRKAVQVNDADAYPLTIPLSIVLGLLLPVTYMLIHPTDIVPTLLFLFCPILIALTQTFLSILGLRATTKSPLIFYAIPILASTLSHTAILFLPILDGPASSAGAAALRFLRLDHTIIYFTILYWIAASSSTTQVSSSAKSTPNVLITIVTTVVLGPGAGVCVGWMVHSGADDTSKTPKKEQIIPTKKQEGVSSRDIKATKAAS